MILGYYTCLLLKHAGVFSTKRAAFITKINLGEYMPELGYQAIAGAEYYLFNSRLSYDYDIAKNCVKYVETGSSNLHYLTYPYLLVRISIDFLDNRKFIYEL